MVGVAGRSKACQNCYRRRIKCDETRPKCRKCEKAKLDCPGYKSITIIQYDHNLGRTRKSTKGKSSDNDSTDSSRDERERILTQLVQGYQNWNPTRPNTAFDVPPTFDQVAIHYTLANLVSAVSQQSLTANVHRDLSDRCFMALSTFFFGNEHHERAVVKHGLNRYGKVLKDLNLALADTAQRQTFDVLEAVILATLLEFLASDNPDGWIAHSIGLERLIDIRGPESFTSIAERSILERSRPSIIFACLVKRKDTIFSRAEWKYVPWNLGRSYKSQLDHLIDIMADCPQLLVMQDQIHSTLEESGKVSQALLLLDKVQAIREKLKEWRLFWDATEYNCSVEEPATPVRTSDRVSSDVSKSSWQTRLVYKSLYHANAVTMHDGTLIFLERISNSAACAGLIGPQDAKSLREASFAAGIEIIRSMEYCIENARGSLGSFFILFPIRMAWWIMLHREPTLQDILESALQKIKLGAAGHWAIAGYLLSLGRPELAEQPLLKPYAEAGAGL